MDGSGKARHVLLRVNVYEEDDVDVRECDNTNSKRVAHGRNTVEAEHSQHIN